MTQVIDKSFLNKAMLSLAQRSYSSNELTQKLFTFFSSQSSPYSPSDLMLQCKAVVDYCIERNWIDDSQYISEYIDMRCRKGCGSNRIIAELKQKGLPVDLIRSILNEKIIDWVGLAKIQIEKKYRQIDKHDVKQRTKIFQFLIYRGFNHHDIQLAYLSLQ